MRIRGELAGAAGSSKGYGTFTLRADGRMCKMNCICAVARHMEAATKAVIAVGSPVLITRSYAADAVSMARTVDESMA